MAKGNAQARLSKASVCSASKRVEIPRTQIRIPLLQFLVQDEEGLADGLEKVLIELLIGHRPDAHHPALVVNDLLHDIEANAGLLTKGGYVRGRLHDGVVLVGGFRTGQ